MLENNNQLSLENLENQEQTKKHEDFGEKIGGAKKDLWRSRGLIADDLLEMNEREADKFVKKDNVWKKNYEAIIESGVSAEVVYFMKTIRDSIAPNPLLHRSDNTDELKAERRKQYVETVREIQGMTESVKTKEEAQALFQKYIIDNGYFESKGHRFFNPTDKARLNPVITSKLFNALSQAKNNWQWNVQKPAERTQFGVSKDQKIPKGYSIHFHDERAAERSNSRNEDWNVNTYWISQKTAFGNVIVGSNFESRDEAIKAIQEIANESKAKSGKKRFIPKQLEKIVREGADYRGGRDIEGQDYIDTFGFKGGEFGNWVNQNERQASLNYGYEALKDLAEALKISDNDISYKGDLSIAFGARGSGSFAAHYEPLRKVINLTKMKGAGSLAHEWWHGFDDYLGKNFGFNTLLSDIRRDDTVLSKLIDTMKYRIETPEEVAESHKKVIDWHRNRV